MAMRRVAVATAALGAASASAQSLKTFLDAADTQNLDVRLGVQATVTADSNFGQAWGALLPALTATGDITHNQYAAIVTIPTGPSSSEKITITPMNQRDLSLKVELPLLDATRWLKTASARASLDGATQRELATRDTVRRQVVSGYYGFAGAGAVLDSARRSLELSRAQLEQQDVRHRAGVATELDLVRASAEVARNEQLVADAEVQAELARRTLETLSGLEVKQSVTMPDDDLHPEADLKSFEDRVGALPQVQAAQLDATSASRNWTAAALALVPTVNGQFTEKFTNATGFQGANELWNAGVNLNWRLDAVGVQGIRAASAAEQTAALNAEKARQTARDQVHSDWLKVRAALSKVRSAKAQVESARRAEALARDRNAAGVANQLDVIQASRDLFSAEVNDIQARFELTQARVALRLSAGLPLEVTP